jgi:hypothetical protein
MMTLMLDSRYNGQASVCEFVGEEWAMEIVHKYGW